MDIIEGLKNTASALRKADKIPEFQLILDVQQELLKQQKRISDLETENKKLREKLELKGKVKFERNAYWIVEEGKEDDGPFCSCCFDDERKLIRMMPGWSESSRVCPKCKNNADVSVESHKKNYKTAY
ncbi:MAG: hypothetical protein WCJ25_02160 [Candidatus Moraniibacteriota bacterium]